MEWFIIAWLEAKYPGVKPLLEWAKDRVDLETVATVLSQAMIDYQKGMRFIDILQDLLASHLTPAQAMEMRALVR